MESVKMTKKQLQLIPTLGAVPGSEAWLAARRGGIGASEVPAILGLDNYRSGLDVWAEKRGMLVGQRTDSPQATVGRFAESMIAHLYEHQTDEFIVPVPAARHSELSILSASADRMRTTELSSPDDTERWLYPIEIKNRGGFPRGWGEAGTNEVPDEIAVQVIVQMACYNMEEARVAALLSGNDFRIYTIVRDRELEDSIVSRVADWWARHIVNGEEPPLTGASVDKYLAKKFQQGTKEVVELELHDPAAQTMAKLLNVKKQLAELEADEKDYANQIKAVIGDKGGVKSIYGKALWSTVAPTTAFDAKKAWEIAASVLDAETRARIEADAVIEKAGYRRFVLTAAKGV